MDYTYREILQQIYYLEKNTTLSPGKRKLFLSIFS